MNIKYKLNNYMFVIFLQKKRVKKNFTLALLIRDVVASSLEKAIHL